MRAEQVTIYKEPGRYAGWPANYGIWNWNDEIVVGFTVGYHQSDAGFHTRDRDRPFVGMQARSPNGGATWESVPVPAKTPGDRSLSADEHMADGSGLRVGEALEGKNAPQPCPGDLDFTHPDFALMCAKTGLQEGSRSFFYLSDDRCRSWQGPYRLPMFDQTGIAARTDYLVDDATTCSLFLTANKRDGKEGHIFCARTTDGGKTFAARGWITNEPSGFSIMPANVRLPSGRILVADRCRERVHDLTDAINWIDLYASDDDGATWQRLNRPVENTGRGGNPPTLKRLHDGRLCLTYGFRDAPYRICAKLSDDDGASWSNEIVLRDNGGGHDIGYPRTIQRADGKIVTVYYWHDTPDGERHIAATIWDPTEAVQ
ncbi:MAG: sialidase family protein [Candidatus Poribacteria bacterium]|nr:sialidase family protein [Candidatus Poribacteria bacterium]